MAVATLTYDYADSMAVLGPLAVTREPHTYDLCDAHANHLTVPRGWEVVRLQTSFDPPPPPDDDLLALADAVRSASDTSSPDSSDPKLGVGLNPVPSTGTSTSTRMQTSTSLVAKPSEDSTDEEMVLPSTVIKAELGPFAPQKTDD